MKTTRYETLACSFTLIVAAFQAQVAEAQQTPPTLYRSHAMTERNTPLVDHFDQTIKDIEAASDAERSSLVVELSKQIEAAGAPVLLDETRVAFVYRGPGKRVRVAGDMTNWSSELVLQQIADTDLFVGVTKLPADARVEYIMHVDDQSMRDPLCPFHVLNGIGGSSELAMPKYQHHPVFVDDVRSGKVGGYDRVTKLTMESAALGYEKEVHVYRPPNVDPTMRCATVYFHDGRDYIEYAHMPELLNWLIEHEQICPLNAVFVSPPNRHQPKMPNRTTEYGLNPKYVTFIADELVPLIDKRFATIAAADSRMTVGDSYAGLVSASIVHSRSDCFGIGYSQSGYLSCESDAMIKAFKNKPKLPIRLYVDVGIFERTVGKGWLPDEEIDFVAANQRFRDVLAEEDYEFEYREYPEGHTWGNWRRHVADALVHYFGR